MIAVIVLYKCSIKSTCTRSWWFTCPHTYYCQPANCVVSCSCPGIINFARIVLVCLVNLPLAVVIEDAGVEDASVEDAGIEDAGVEVADRECVLVPADTPGKEKKVRRAYMKEEIN